jgi:WD40 repeat protein
MLTPLPVRKESYVVPDSVLHTFRGHRRNVKALAWVGSEGRSLVSGSSDGSVRLWDAESARCEAVLDHGGRVWDVDATIAGQHVLSAGGDGTVKLWGRSGELKATMGSAVGDVYACRWNQAGTAILTGGYDKLVRLYDAQTAALTSTFTGHSLGISR